MKIQGTGIELRRSELAKQVQTQVESGKKQESSTAAPAPRSDRVQISSAGRALASQAAVSVGHAAEAEGLSPARVAEIRGRILQGAYNSVEVVDQVARRMLDRGDI